MKKYTKNGTDIIIKNNPKTPRAALSIYFASDKPEKLAGVYALYARLLIMGTKKYNSKELALMFENNGISVVSKHRQDYFYISTLFLNEDTDLALELTAEVIKNSTFSELEKEVHKIKGEIKSELDNPLAKIKDVFIGEFFKGHYYGNSYEKILQDIDKITLDDILEVHKQIMQSKKVIVAVGDIKNPEAYADKIAEIFCFEATNETKSRIENVEPLSENHVIKIEKNDLQQAHIIQGFRAVNLEHKDYAAIVVMNNILGSSGLSSRLFVELRDKKGLAYTVRSSIEALVHGSILYLYIATDPKNIKASLDGFEVEMSKMQNELVDDIELQGAKENVLGRLEYFSQTNSQQAANIANDYIIGLGLDFEAKYCKMINELTAQDVMNAAKKYLSKPSIVAILAPKEYLS